MQWDAISDQWLWIGAAGVFIIFVGALAARSLYKSKPHHTTTSDAAAQNGWTPTGRIDFVDPQSKGDFILQVEETRIVDSMGGIEHREIQWRKATLDEAKTVLVSYHAQRNLTMTANFIVASPTVMRRSSDGRNEDQETQLKKNGASDAPPEEHAKPDGDATYVLPKASRL
jgi:hypothetical protein